MPRKWTENKYDRLVFELDGLIKAGKIGEVSKLVSQLRLANVPRNFRQSLAKICRRAGLVPQGLRLLQPLVHNQKEKLDPATPGEICEYAVLLSRNGSIQEAMNLLKNIDPAKNPEALTYLAYCHISNWNYAEAAPLLESFLQSDAEPYSKLVARVNLASAYLETSQFDRAEKLLSEVIPMLEEANASRLVANSYELWGQVHFQKNEFSKSKQALSAAMRTLENSQVDDQLLVFRTQALVAAFEEKSIEPLMQFRDLAITRKHWECVREVDLYKTLIQFDQNLLDYLTFGTPMPAFRRRIIQSAGQPSDSFVLGHSDGALLDLETGRIQGVKNQPKQKIHQVIAALVKDFYMPRNVGTLFSELYGDEYFDISSSPGRVRQLVWRTKQWFEENHLPVSIEQIDGAYRLSIHGPFGIRIPLEGPASDSNARKLRELKTHFSTGTSFSAEQACQYLNLSRSSFHRFAEWAIKTGELQKTGTASRIVYQFSGIQASGIKKSVA